MFYQNAHWDVNQTKTYVLNTIATLRGGVIVH